MRDPAGAAPGTPATSPSATPSPDSCRRRRPAALSRHDNRSDSGSRRAVGRQTAVGAGGARAGWDGPLPDAARHDDRRGSGSRRGVGRHCARALLCCFDALAASG